MKITALLVLKCDPKTPEPVILANVSNLLQFEICTFYRSNLEEFIVFIARTVAKRTPPGQCHSVKHEEYKVHAYNINGLCAVGFMDDHYPVRSAFSLLDQVLDAYQKDFGDTWRFADRMRHISFNILTLFASSSDLNPKPPSFLGVHTSDHETIAFLLFKEGPDHKKAEHILSISWIQALGSLNAAIQKFVMLKITDFSN